MDLRRAHRCSPSIINQQLSIINSDGFTLIELLVVIAIIALLIAIFLPGLQRARSQARAMVCQSRLRAWAMALAAYTEEHRGRLPSDRLGFDGVWLLRGTFLTGEDPNARQDSFYHFHTQEIACCPMATRPFAPAQRGTFRLTNLGTVQQSSFGSYVVSGTPGAALVAWEITAPGPAFRGSYGLNQWLFRGFDDSSGLSSYALQHGSDLDVLCLRGRTDIPVLLDAVGPVSAPRYFGAPMGSDGSANNQSMANFATDRHGGSTNALFLDWSVRKVGIKELWTLYWYRKFDRSGPWTKAGGVTPEQWPEWMRDFKDY